MRIKTLAILLASTTLTVMAGSIIAPVLNLMREGLSVDSASVGLNGVFLVVAAICGSLFLSLLTRRLL